VPDEERIAAILGSPDAFECQECHWEGRNCDLLRAANDDGSVDLVCPNCDQAHYIFPA
jgi:NAD-dependent SIR2 family protein deacetylase